MEKKLEGKTVAVLVADGFEQDELTRPVEALRRAGAQVKIVSPARGEVRGWRYKDWGDSFGIDVPLAEASADSFNALLLPGGVMNPDTLRQDDAAIDFVHRFMEEGKPIAAICHGPWTLIEAGVVQGRKMTSYPSIRTDLENAGANWVDEEVVVDNGIITSRSPKDIPAFCCKMVDEFAGTESGRAEPERTGMYHGFPAGS